MRAGPAFLTANLLPILRIDRRMARPTGCKFQITFVQQDGNGIEVGRMGLESHAVGLQWYRSSASERVENCGKLTIAVLQHLAASFFIHLGMLVQPTLHHPADDVEESLAFRVLLTFRRPLFRVGRRVVYNGGE